MSTSIDAKLAAIDNILATPVGTPNVTLGLLNQAKNIADKNPDKGKIDTPFGNLFARDAVFLFDELNKMGVSDPSKLSAQVVGDKVVYKDGTTGNVVQESKVSEGGSLKLGKTGGKTGDVEGYDLFMVPNEQGGLTLASDKVEQSNWLKFRDNVLKPAAIVGGAYLAATTLPGLLGGGGAGATATGAGAVGAEAGLANTIAGLSPETLATLEATGLANIPEIVGATGGLLDAGLAAGAAGLAGTAANAAGAAKAGTTLPGSTIANAATTAAKALLGGGDNKLLGNIVGSGVDLAMVQDAADKLRTQGQISQQEYEKLSSDLQTKYTNLGLFGQQGLENVGRTAASMVGNFTPYGVTNQLFGTRVNPETGAVETTLTNVGEELYNPFARVAAQSAQAAEMTNVDQLAKDYYAKVAALSAPEIERQRLATEDRLRAQGRLGVSGSAFGGSSPELLAQEQAIARQQLERELQSRQAALGERGTLIGQGNAAYAPISNLLGLQAQQQQLSGQLGQMAQQGRIAAAQLYAQPAAQGYTSALNVGAQGLGQMAQTERTGIASNLAAQQAALDASAIGRSNIANNLLGANGANVGNITNAISSGVNFFTNPNAAGNLNTLGFGTGLGYGNEDIGLFL
jgi:hypothetical protein